ncbi:MAG TPA: hypothetical protein PK257_01660 [Candidatus Woesebacteria bacterium]|nr:hypothetical protein [Candidatus Woesebacteria bacterium]
MIKMDPFLGQEKITSIIDLDGALCEYGEKSSFNNGISRLLGLKSIIEKSEEFIVYSSRIHLDEDGRLWQMIKSIFGQTSIVHCPFMVESSKKRLEKFIKKANEDCNFKYMVGLRKMRSCFAIDDDLQEIAQKTLKENKKLVMIGSSCFDKMIAKRNFNSSNVFYFDTGHVLV